MLDSDTGASSAALRALLDTQSGLSELQRLFPLPTVVPESQLFDRAAFEAERLEERERTLHNAAVASELRLHALKRPERREGESASDFSERLSAWRSERAHLFGRMREPPVEGALQETTAEEEERTLEGFFSSQTDALFAKVRQDKGADNAVHVHAAPKSASTLTAAEQEEAALVALLPRDAEALDLVSDAQGEHEEDARATRRRGGGGGGGGGKGSWSAEADARDTMTTTEAAEEEEEARMPGTTPEQYRVRRLAVVHLSERKVSSPSALCPPHSAVSRLPQVWLSEVWLRPDVDAEGQDDFELGQLGAPHLVREQVLDIPGDWLTLFKRVAWPARTLRQLQRVLEGHLHMTQGAPAVLAALQGQAPLE